MAPGFSTRIEKFEGLEGAGIQIDIEMNEGEPAVLDGVPRPGKYPL